MLMNETQRLLDELYPNFDVKIPDHWLRQGFDSSGWLLQVAGFFVLILIFSSYFNSGLWLLVFIKNKFLRTPSNILVLSLVCSDLVMFNKSWIFVINAIYGGPYLGRLGCYGFAAFGLWSGTVQIWTITAIALERAKTIVYPLHQNTTRLQSSITVGIIWSLATAVVVMPLFGLNSYVSEAYFVSCSFDTWTSDAVDKAYVIALIVVCYIVPLLIITLSYVTIFVATKKSRRNVKNATRNKLSSDEEDTPNDLSQSVPMTVLVNTKFQSGAQSEVSSSKRTSQRRCYFSKKSEEREMRLAGMLLFLFIIWAITWTPYAVIATMQEFGYGTLVAPWVSLLAIIIAKISSVTNTVIYGLRLPKFRYQIKRLGLPCFDTKTKKRPHPVLQRQTLNKQPRSLYNNDNPNNGTIGFNCNDSSAILPRTEAALNTILNNNKGKINDQLNVEPDPVSERLQEAKRALEEECIMFEKLGKKIQVRVNQLEAQNAPMEALAMTPQEKEVVAEIIKDFRGFTNSSKNPDLT